MPPAKPISLLAIPQLEMLEDRTTPSFGDLLRTFNHRPSCSTSGRGDG
jgi:hypothetical protein